MESTIAPFSFTVEGTSLTCQTRADLFSPKALDKGTEALMQQIKDLDYDSALDWGCGWGALGLWLSKRKPKAFITLIDSDLSAIKAAQNNAKLNELKGADIVLSAGYEEVEPQATFDLIVSNPPTHRGREVLESMIRDSKLHLNKKGKLVIVVEARLKPWVQRSLNEVFGECEILDRTSKHVVLSAHA